MLETGFGGLASRAAVIMSFLALAAAAAAAQGAAGGRPAPDDSTRPSAAGRLRPTPRRGPLVDRFALLVPGVVEAGDADFANGVGLSSNGQRPRSNSFQLDGHDNNDHFVGGPAVPFSNPEAVGEYHVLTSNHTAEHGAGAGAQLNLFTRAGTNEFHGALFWHHGNSALNASDNLDEQYRRDFAFVAARGAPELAGLARRRVRAPFRQNRFGGALGGPVRVDKAFFFAAYQGDDTRGESAASGIGRGRLAFDAPSVLLASALGLPGTSALSNDAPGSRSFVVGPAVDLDGDGAADACANAQPDGRCALVPVLFVNTSGGTRPLSAGEAVRVFKSDAADHQFVTRLDLNLTDSDMVTARYVFDDASASPAAGRPLAGALFDALTRAHNLALGYSRTLSPRFVHEARFTFSRLEAALGDTARPPAPAVTLAGTRDLRRGHASLDFGPPVDLPQSRRAETFQYQDQLAAALGNHTLRLGADFRRLRAEQFFLPRLGGAYTFLGGDPTLTTPGARAGLIPPGTPFVFGPGFGLPAGTPRTGFGATAFENLLLGRPSAVAFTRGDPRAETTRHDLFLFFHEEWRVLPTLTLNAGLRYEYSTQPLDRLSADLFDPSSPAEFRTAPRVSTDGNNFAPRVGLSWSPDWNFGGERFRNGRTTLRAGFSVAYDPVFLNLLLDTLTGAPFAASATAVVTPGAAAFPFAPPDINLTPGTDGGDPRLFSRTTVDPGLYHPYTMQWSVGLQQELRYRTVLEVRYVGSRTVGQFQDVNANPDLRFLNRAAQCLGLDPGAFTRGRVGGPAAPNPAAACAGSGFDSRGLDATGTRIGGSGRLDPSLGPVRLYTNGATATYHGMHVRLDARLADGLTVNSNYVWSKTLDNASEIYPTFGGGQTVAHAQNPFDLNVGERALSAFHQKHNFASSFAYELPFREDQDGFVGRLLGGFQVTGVVRLGSGRPYTPTNLYASYDPAWDVYGFGGAGSLRPFNGNPHAPAGTIAVGNTAAAHIVGGAPGPSPTGFWVYDTRSPGSQPRPGTARDARLVYNDFGNFSLFGLPLTDAEAFQLFRTPYGDVGRNTFTGEPFYVVNLALLKTTNVTDDIQIEFRAEAANLLNRRNFGTPDPFTEDAYLGSAVGPFQNPGRNDGAQRELRLGLRLIF